MHGEKLKSIYA